MYYASTRYQLLRGLRSRLGKTAVIFPATFLVATGLGCMQLGIVFYARDRFGAGPARIGLLTGSWSLAYMAGCVMLRPLSRQLLPRHCILAATVVMAILTQSLMLAETLAQLFGLYICLGVAISFFWPPLMGWLSANREGPSLSRAMGWFNLCWSTGTIISPLLAGTLSERHPALPLQTAAGMFLLACGMILGAVLALPALGHDDDAHRQERHQPRRRDGGTPLRFPCWLGLFSTYLILAVLLNVFPVAALDQLHVSKTGIGTILLVRAFSTTVCLGLFGKSEWWHFRAGQIPLGTVVLAAAVLLLIPAAHPVVIGLVMALFGTSVAHAYANSIFHGVSGSVRRAARMAVHESLLSGGLFTGAALGGLVYERAGLTTLYTCCASLALVTAVAQAIITRSARRDRPAARRRIRPASCPSDP